MKFYRPPENLSDMYYDWDRTLRLFQINLEVPGNMIQWGGRILAKLQDTKTSIPELLYYLFFVEGDGKVRLNMDDAEIINERKHPKTRNTQPPSFIAIPWNIPGTVLDEYVLYTQDKPSLISDKVKHQTLLFRRRMQILPDPVAILLDPVEPLNAVTRLYFAHLIQKQDLGLNVDELIEKCLPAAKILLVCQPEYLDHFPELKYVVEVVEKEVTDVQD